MNVSGELTGLRTAISWLRKTFRPRFLPWTVANVMLFIVVESQYEEVTVEPGQGGTVRVFIWPFYQETYTITDVAFPSVSISWPALIGNYLIVVIPLYLVMAICWNLLVPDRFEPPRIPGKEGREGDVTEPSLPTAFWIVVAIVTLIAVLPTMILTPWGLPVLLVGSIGLGLVEWDLSPGKRVGLALLVGAVLLVSLIPASFSNLYAVLWVATTATMLAFFLRISI